MKPSMGSTNRATLEWLTDHVDEMVGDLAYLVEAESPSDDPTLLEYCATRVIELIERRVGEPTRRASIEGRPYGDTYLMEWDRRPRNSVALLCHYDTVWPAGTLNGWPFTVHDGRASGPGAFDMKAGLVQAIWALAALRALNIEAPSIRLVLNGDEELGSIASRPHLERFCVDQAAALVFEASVDGAVKTQRKGVAVYDLIATGIEAHAGLDPTRGASAVHALVEVATEVLTAARPASGTTINVGEIRGGSRANVVAGDARARVDVRADSRAEQARIEGVFKALESSDPRVKLSVHGGWNRPPLVRGPGTEWLYDRAAAVARQLGFELKERAAGGASDGNLIGAQGIPVLDGLGAVGNGAHARGEWVVVQELPRRAALAAGLLSVLAEERPPGND